VIFPSSGIESDGLLHLEEENSLLRHRSNRDRLSFGAKRGQRDLDNRFAVGREEQCGKNALFYEVIVGGVSLA